MNSNPSPDQREEERPTWREVFDACEPGLRAFLQARLSQSADVDDCLQVVWVKALESGDAVAENARRAWLFRVASNESARMWRRKSTTDRVLEKQSRYVVESAPDDALQRVIQDETHQELSRLIEGFPRQTQRILELKIYEGLTFQQIANKLRIPLGTAITKMNRALRRIRETIESKEP